MSGKSDERLAPDGSVSTERDAGQLAPTPKSGLLKAVRLFLAVIVPVVLLYFVVRSIAGQWETVKTHPWDWQFGPLAISLIVGWVVFILINQLWRHVLRIVAGRALDFLTSYRITALSNLGKYLPGKFWAFVSMVYLLNREGFSPSVSVASTVLHQAFTVVAGAVFIVTVLGVDILGQTSIPTLVVGLGGCLVLLYPPVFRRVLNFGLRILRRPEVSFHYSFLHSLGLFGCYVISWILYGASSWFLLAGLGLDPGPFWPVVGAFDAAYLLGFLALFAPGGLGVREGILTVLLTPHFGSGVAALLSVVSRIWITFLEIVQLTPLLLLRKTPQK